MPVSSLAELRSQGHILQTHISRALLDWMVQEAAGNY
jgi:hypothetical protein